MRVLEVPFIAATRRNHALEHATITILSERHPWLRVVGRSDWGGFTLYGTVDTLDVADAVAEGLQRLGAGEQRLAVHERCGTNLATGVVLAGIASYAVARGRRRSSWEKALAWAVGVGTALSLAQPLGLMIQERVTTSADVSDVRIANVLRQELGALTVHRIETTQG